MSGTDDFNLIFVTLDRLNPEWQRVASRKVFAVGERLLEPSAKSEGLFFPVDGLISFIVRSGVADPLIQDPRIKTREKLKARDKPEATFRDPLVGMIGRWGVTGTETLCGGWGSTVRAEVDVQAAGMWVPMKAARAIVDTCSASREVFERYQQHRYIETVRFAADMAHLDNGQRLAMWLDEASECLGSPVVPITHERLSERLCIRRPSVGEDLKALAQVGAIKLTHERGRIDIVDGEILSNIALGAPASRAGRFVRMVLTLGQRADAA